MINDDYWVSCKAESIKEGPRGCWGTKALQYGSTTKSRLVVEKEFYKMVKW